MLYSFPLLAALCAGPPAEKPSLADVLLQSHLNDLNSQDAYCRLHAVNNLAFRTDQAMVVVPRLVKVLQHDRDPEVREAAVYGLGKVGRGDREAIQALVGALHDPEQSVCFGAARSLAEQGDARGVPVLSAALVAWRPGRYLPVLGAASALVFGPLLNGRVESKVGRKFGICLYFLQEIWEDNAEHRQEAADALGSLGPKARAAVPLLRSALQDHEKSVRKATAKALKTIEGKGR